MWYTIILLRDKMLIKFSSEWPVSLLVIKIATLLYVLQELT